MNTKYFLNQILGNVYHTKPSPALPENYYLGICSGQPDVDGHFSGEPSSLGTGYERIKLTVLSQPENGVIKNSAPISFNESITDWGVMHHYVVFDSPSGGNLLFYGGLTTNRSIEPGTVLTIKSGELRLELSNAI